MTLSVEGIRKYLNTFDEEAKAIKEEILGICWHMRGSISYDEGMLLSVEDRKIIEKIIKSHVEVTNKTGLPYF